MSLDGWNLLASSVAALLAAGGLIYQVRRDRRAGIPGFIVRVEHTDAEGQTRLVVASTSSGDASWSLTAIEVIEPEGAILIDQMSPGGIEGRRLIVQPPSHIGTVTGVYGLLLRPRHTLAIAATKFSLRLTLRNVEGRTATVVAFGHKR